MRLVDELAAGGAHSRDHMRLDADAAVGEGRVGGNHFKRRHFGRAQSDGQTVFQRAFNPHFSGEFDDLFRPDFFCKIQGRGVDALCLRNDGCGARRPTPHVAAPAAVLRPTTLSPACGSRRPYDAGRGEVT